MPYGAYALNKIFDEGLCSKTNQVFKIGFSPLLHRKKGTVHDGLNQAEKYLRSSFLLSNITRCLPPLDSKNINKTPIN